MEWGGLLLCIGFERVGVCRHSCGGSNTGGEGERERETGWRGRWREAGNGDWKGQKEGPWTGNREGPKQRPVLGARQRGYPRGWEWVQGASTIQCLKDSLTGKVRLGIRFWQSSRSSVVLLQEVSGRIFEITELFTSMLFSSLPDFIYLHSRNSKST